jgi:hypothetical protein
MWNLALRRCVDCKFFKKDFITDPKFGKCLKFPKKEETDTYYWVTGKKEKHKIDYSYCAVARDNESMCGMQGNKFEPRP